MMNTTSFVLFFLMSFLSLSQPSFGQMEKTIAPPFFEPMDVFDLEYVSDPQISPDGQYIVYVRNFKDVMTDQNLSNLWIIGFDGNQHHPLTTGNQKNFSPRWSADGKELIYISNKSGKTQLYRRWMDTGIESKLTNLHQSISNISWSPDGQWIAFSMLVDEEKKPLVQLPDKPKGAKWANTPIYIDRLTYRADGAGYLPMAYQQIFLLSIEGGTPRQMTFGPYQHGSNLSWTPNSKSIIFSANRHDDREFNPNNSEIHELNIATGKVTGLTKRLGPDRNPVLSSDGKYIAYLGFDDVYQGYQIAEIYLMDRATGKTQKLLEDLDRNIDQLQWSNDAKRLFFRYDDRGKTAIGYTDLQGSRTTLTDQLGGMSLGRPYTAGTFSVSNNNRVAFTFGEAQHPADLGAMNLGKAPIKRLTRLNDDLFAHKQLGEVEEIWFTSSFDKRRIQGWICKPPNFDPKKKYPLILEIHGGPFAAYGPHFSSEVQLYAAAGYVVLYANPRGSSSYGREFGNLIHHNYPSQDYDDLMSGVDAVIAKAYINEEQLFVTGGSGGGVLTSWIIGKTDRFKAAVVAKPVINWYSFVLHADNPAFFYKYWFPGLPWEHQDHYMARSPISLVGNVKTPTMLLTGEQDYRTPMSETEQYYAALKLNKVESAMVRIQEAGHGIAARPSNLMAKVMYVLAWFEQYK